MLSPINELVTLVQRSRFAVWTFYAGTPVRELRFEIASNPSVGTTIVHLTGFYFAVDEILLTF
jgi:hypothetical protein